jgi:hypothetical protein
MDYSTGKLAFILVVAVLMSCCGAWWIAYRYRAAMQRLMSAPPAAVPRMASHYRDRRDCPIGIEAGSVAMAPASPLPVSANDNRCANLRLAVVLIALSCLMAVTSAALFLVLAIEAPFSFKRLAVLGLVHTWPVVPVLGLKWRWSRVRLLAILLLWCLLCFAVLWWRSIEPQPLGLVLFLAGEVGAPMLLVALLCLGDATRAIASWLLPPLVGLVWASVLGVDLLGLMVEGQWQWLQSLPSWLSGGMLIALFALAPWLLAWWPLRWLGRALARAYVNKVLSELMVLFTAVWAISLLFQALSSASSLGLGGLAMLLPLAWVPIVMVLSRCRAAPEGRPPTLLVLRVFQRHAEVQELFDQVIERWRLTGNTVLIAGTDLADRTLDAADIFTFLDGGLAQRFIHTPADVAPRLARFDMARDADTQYRINPLYCHDTTWQQALDALVLRSDVVLMDLRGFQAHNAGCCHELATLARAQRLTRVVVLVGDQTDRAAATAAAAGAQEDRFLWLETTGTWTHERRQILESLLVASNGGR